MRREGIERGTCALRWAAGAGLQSGQRLWQQLWLALLACCAMLALAACGGSGGDEGCRDCPPAPTITTQPTAVTVPDGSTASFSVVARGEGLRYQWRADGADVSGATSPSYTTPANGLDRNGTRFSVVVSNAGGSVTSSAALLAVTAVAPTITTSPAALSVVAGSTARFAVEARGSAPMTYEWLRNGTVVAGATGSELVLPTVETADDGALIRVRVTNAAGSADSADARLTVTPVPAAPAITGEPASLAVNVGQTATFRVVATGTAPLAYQWRRNGSDIAGATSADYITPPATLADSGAAYTVAVRNAAGTAVSGAATLTVLPPAPTIVAQPASVSVSAGQPARFDVVAGGEGPFRYQWARGGVAIAGADTSSYTLTSAGLADSGAAFSVTVTNAGGSTTSAVATLTVNAAAVAPAITAQPQPQSVVAGASATFGVTASGTAPLAYQWQRNGTVIAGATAATYTTPPTGPADSGAVFRVQVSNAAGSVLSDPATLSVRADGPTITSQPRALSVLVGRPATFAVAATASQGALSYQWRRNGGDIAGETGPSYTLARTTFADHNVSFSVVVRDARGSVVSDSVALSVTPIGVEHVYPSNEGLLSRNLDGSVWVVFDAPGAPNGATRTVTPLLLRDTGGFVVTGFDQLDAGTNTAVAVDAAGGVWAWGDGTGGRLGDGIGSSHTAFAPVRVTDSDGSPLRNATAVQMNFESGFALLLDGTVRGWGTGSQSAGTGSTAPSALRARPVVDAADKPLTGVVQLMAEPRADRAIARRTDGTLWGWGGPGGGVFPLSGEPGSVRFSDHAIQLKDGAGVPIASPRSASMGLSHAVVVLGDGTVIAWGDSYYGQLGDGTSGSTSGPYSARPMRNATGGLFDNVVSAAAGPRCTLLLRADGSVWATGDNSLGCIGDATSVNRSIPVPVIESSGLPLTGVVEIHAGLTSFIAKKSDGSFWVWGNISGGSRTPLWRSAVPLTGFEP